MKLTLINALILLIIFQCNVFTFYLITLPKGKKTSNLILAGITLCLGLHFTNILVVGFSVFKAIPQFNPIFSLLYGPLVYFYAQSLIYKDIDLAKLRFNVHAFANMPLLSYAVFWILDDYQNRQNNQALNSYVTVPVLIQFGLYLLITYRSLVRYQRILNNTQSSVVNIRLSWLKFINVMMAIFWLLVTIEFFVPIPFVQYFIVELIFAAILFMVLSFVYKGLRHPNFFAGIAAEDEAATFEAKEVLNKQSSVKQQDLDAVQQYMENEKPYHTPELSLQQLAEALKFSPRYLSQLINQQLQQNFFEFVNTYRIEEAKALLTDPENRHMRINEIMYQVGFQSKSTFNQVFKKFTGVTPTQFRDKII
ncbi:MAG TPA: hypothetical protein DCS93_44175 [Microscillaceae bacterium]|nr:hypothetical protein [Microscillaceae bacterium]